jgi:hypothetical protein
MTSAYRTLGDAACLAAFALALCAPMGARALDPEADRSTLPEQRNPAPLPALQAGALAFPASFDAWLGDHYGFRGTLIRWHNRIKLFGFGVSPTERLVVGDRHWLFTTSNRALEAYRGAFRLSDGDLEAWGRALEERRAWLAERGAHYLVVFAPGKPSVYGEHLPDGYAPGALTPLDQLQAHLAATTAVELLDLRPALRAARAEDGTEQEDDWLFHRLGTHWTERGAWVAYREILAAVRAHFPDLALPRVEDYERRPNDDPGDSWAGRLRIPDLLVQRSVAFRKRGPLRSRPLLDTSDEKIFELPPSPDASAPRPPSLLLLHDSFGDHLRDYLREDFARFHARNSVDFETELILATRPDVVVQLMAERRLASYRPPASVLGGDAAASAAFAGAGAPLYALRSAAQAARLAPWRRAQLLPATEPDDPPVVVRLRRSGDGFLLPALELPEGHAPILRIDLEVAQEGELAVFYQTPQSPEYVSMRQVARLLPAGRSVVHLDLGVSDSVGPLLILPGRVKGDYALRGLEVRARPRD